MSKNKKKAAPKKAAPKKAAPQQNDADEMDFCHLCNAEFDMGLKKCPCCGAPVLPSKMLWLTDCR